MMDWPNVCHVVGGAAAACIVLAILRWPKWVRATMAIAMGTLANALWEVFADILHWLPYHAQYPDRWDIYRGGLGALIIALIYLFGSKE